MPKLPKKVLTLCIVHENNRILLGMKKRGFGMGRYNGFGGKVEPNETIEEATRRELKEESGIEVEVLNKLGVIEFSFEGEKIIHQVHIFKGLGIIGEPQETEEMKPQWFSINEIPFGEMWPSDAYWFPYFLTNKKFKGRVYFADNHTVLAAKFR
jgi:8-oxo-dGTP diphosphatase/2-hydroxy-dATP diphosphatase